MSHALCVAGECKYKDGLYYSRGHVIEQSDNTEEGGTMEASGSKDELNALWTGI